MKLHILLFAIAFGLVACNSRSSGPSALQVTDPQSQEYHQNERTGGKYVISRRKGSVVLASLSKEKTWAEFGAPVLIRVRNTGAAPIAFSAANVRATQNGRALRVLDQVGVQHAIDGRNDSRQLQGAAGMLAGSLGVGIASSGIATKVTHSTLAAGLAGPSSALVRVSAVSMSNAREEAEVMGDETGAFIGPQTIPSQGSLSGIVVIADADSSVSPISLEIAAGEERHAFTVGQE